MRVLWIVSAYPRSSGDIITPWLGESIVRLKSAGIDVEVLAPAFRGGASHVVNDVRVHRFRYAPKPWEILSHDAPIPAQLRRHPGLFSLVPGYLASASARAIRLVRDEGFDVVHAFWPFPHALPGILARAATGVPLVSTFFGAELHWLPARRGGGWARTAVRTIVRRSDATTAISNFVARELRAIAPDARPTIVPFGAAMTAPPPTALDRAPYDGDGPAALLFVGRLVKRKGVDVLLRAMALLSPEEARLTIVGDGEERQRLESLAVALGIHARVQFAGVVRARQLDAHFRACDAFILPAVHDVLSGTEGLGVVLIEALTYARPVIASDVGGIPDIVRDRVTGSLVPPGDAAALAAALRAFASSPGWARELGVAGRAHAAACFSWTRIVSDLVAVYERVAPKARGSR